MTKTTTDPAPSRTINVFPLATRAVGILTVTVGGLQLAAAIVGRDFWFDEVYMLAIGRNHLDWGSADQPPVAPALAAIIDTLFPDSVVALRIPAVLATALTVLVAALIAREMGCDGRAQTLVAAAQATGLWASVGGHWLTPYALEPLSWLVLIWLLVRWIRIRDDRLLLALGVVAGIAAMTKFQVLLLCAVLVLTVAAVGPRALLRRPSLWGAVGVGTAIAAPTLWWQAQHGWPQLAMTEVVAAEAGPLYGGRGGVAVQLIVFAGVVCAGLALYALIRLARDPALTDYRFLGVTFVMLYVVFAVTPGRPYYLCGLFPAVAAVGALSLQWRREAGEARWQRAAWPIYAVSAVVALSGVVLGAVLTNSDTGEHIARRTADAYHALPPATRDHTAIIGESYIVAAYLDGYSNRFGLPAAFSPTRTYGYFPPPDDSIDTVLLVGDNGPDRLLPYFTEVHQFDGDDQEIGVWLLTGRTESWGTLWPKARTLAVI